MDEIIYDKLSSLSEISKALLEKIFASVPTAKDLTIEPHLIKPLERICGVSWLKAHGIEKIFKLDATLAQHTNTQFFMIYTNTKTFQHVLQQIQSQVDVVHPEFNKFHIICVPKVLYFYEQLVEENALWSIIKLYSFQWYPIHLDTGILSMELPTMFKSIYVHNDCTLLPVFAKSLWHLFLSLGKPSFCIALGTQSNIIVKQLDTILNESNSKLVDSDIGGLIIIDRNVDYPSALLTPGSYSALLHEIYNLKCGVCKEEKMQVGINEKHLDEQFAIKMVKQPVNFVLDSKKDLVYKLIKDKYFIQVTEILRQLTRDLKVQGETSDMALHEMKRYVQTKLQSVAQRKQMVASHLNATETLVQYLHFRLQRLIAVEGNILQNQSKSKSLTFLEEYLQTERDAPSALCLFLLICIAQKVTDSEVKSFLTKFFIEFGYDFGHVYRKLVKLNFIDSVNSFKLKLQLLSKNSFYPNANKLKQLNAEPEKVNLKNPTCCSYVYSGMYIPLVVQIASLVLSGTPMEDLKSKLQNFGDLNVSGYYQNSKKSMLIYIVGGITYSEISSLNLLESMMGVKIIKLGDTIISKNDMAKAFTEY